MDKICVLTALKGNRVMSDLLRSSQWFQGCRIVISVPDLLSICHLFLDFVLMLCVFSWWSSKLSFFDQNYPENIRNFFRSYYLVFYIKWQGGSRCIVWCVCCPLLRKQVRCLSEILRLLALYSMISHWCSPLNPQSEFLTWERWHFCQVSEGVC